MKSNFTGYCMKTRTKDTPIWNAIVIKNKNGSYMVKGDDGNGNFVSTICNEEKALSAVKAGTAKQG